ncbi:putative ABC transporter extracellular solute-binding protein (plasmid) [Octadecabacter arcticus 238]|uniref:Putative ABC transporter extracellular solute-binding protein n=1 Tax=Octadecabacter arcticus 238 TaxID=391616 RepID=M9RWJ0_9RHOB|nr:putative ABC transporter extracellular solute-binding protein [Octadecabacter arcticus 238]
MADWAEKCEGDGVEVTRNQTTKHREIAVASLTANPAQYTTVLVANESMVPLINENLIRSLDDLVAKHGQNLNKSQLITIDGKIMAIAFMANAQHLFVRKDLLEKVNLDTPKTYEEVLAAAKAIQEAGLVKYPFAMLTKPDWNLGQEFVNMYLGSGGQFFEPGTAEATVNNEAGIKALNMLNSLMAYSSPDFLTYDTGSVVPMWQAGNLAIAQFWGNSAAQVIDDKGASEEVVSNTVFASAPTVGGGAIPASTLWWDGFTIAKNISDEDAEATFVAMVNGISEGMVKENNEKAVWLSDAYVPNSVAAGVAATIAGGAEPYPMLPYMGLLHQAFDAELPDFLQGNESAEKTLADVESAYTSAAKQQGFLK